MLNSFSGRTYRPGLWPEPPRPGRRVRWALLEAARLLILALLVSLAVGLVFKNRLIFHPDAGEVATPASYGLKYEEFWLDVGGDRARAWRLPPAGLPAAGPARTVLFFQGNSGNLSLMLDRLSFLASLGLTVLAVDYPGYGPSSGRPSEEAVYEAAEALWRRAAQNGDAPETAIFYGFSLGGGAASHLARRHPPAALVLDSTFTRLRDVPGYGRPWLAPFLAPALGNAFDTRGRLKDIACPLWVFHSPDDDVVPFGLGRELFEGYENNVKAFIQVGGSHMDFVLNLPLYRAGWRDLLTRLRLEDDRGR